MNRDRAKINGRFDRNPARRKLGSFKELVHAVKDLVHPVRTILSTGFVGPVMAPCSIPISASILSLTTQGSDDGRSIAATTVGGSGDPSSVSRTLYLSGTSGLSRYFTGAW